MAGNENKLGKKEIKQKIEDEGYIHTSILFEIVGSPKDHVKKAMKAFLEHINSDGQIITLNEDIDDLIELEGGMYSIAAENDYLVLGLDKLTWLAFNFMPASIEIKAPAELTFRDKDFSGWINDLLSKLHEVNTLHTSLKSQHDAMVRNLNAAIRNSILLAIGEETLAPKALAKKVGIGEKQLVAFLEAMIKEQKIVEEKGKFKKI